MTRWLLNLLGHSRGPAKRQIAVFVFVLALLPTALLVDALLAAIRRRNEEQVFEQEVAHCRRGHDVNLVGAWTCPSCHMTQGDDVHAFSPCEYCGTVSHVACACGLTVRNPLAR